MAEAKYNPYSDDKQLMCYAAGLVSDDKGSKSEQEEEESQSGDVSTQAEPAQRETLITMEFNLQGLTNP